MSCTYGDAHSSERGAAVITWRGRRAGGGRGRGLAAARHQLKSYSKRTRRISDVVFRVLFWKGSGHPPLLPLLVYFLALSGLQFRVSTIRVSTIVYRILLCFCSYIPFFPRLGLFSLVPSSFQAIELDPSSYIYRSNRSACYALQGNHEKAKEEAEACVRINPDFIKGYYR